MQLLMRFRCCGNLKCPLTYNWVSENRLLLLLQMFWQRFYRNVPWVVLYQTYHFCPNLWIWLVAKATEILDLRKKILKNISSEAMRGIKLKLYTNVYSISLYKNGVFIAVAHALLLLWQKMLYLKKIFKHHLLRSHKREKAKTLQKCS